MSQKSTRNSKKKKIQELNLNKLSLKFNIMNYVKPPTKQIMEEPVNVQLLFYSALDLLSNGTGDIVSLQLLFARLTFGRIVAIDYFGEEAAEEIHYHVQTVIIHTDRIVELNNLHQNKKINNVIMDQSDIDEIHSCLKLIDAMCINISESEYEFSGYKLKAELHRNKQNLIASNLIDWDDYKKEQRL